MNLTLHLSAELEAKLREQAKAEGKAPEDVALEALQVQLLADARSVMIPRNEWETRFREWVAAMPDGNPNADLRRGTIYQGRGE